MKILQKRHDGGKDSGVTGYFFIEWKSLFSVAVLRFSPGSREAYHSHAFNALTWWVRGQVTEMFPDGSSLSWKPSLKPKLTPRGNTHKIHAEKVSWAFTLRGPWSPTWRELKGGKEIILTNGRKVVSETPLETK